MGGDMLPRAIEMAREIRRGEAQHSPSVLYGASAGRKDVYRHAMLEAGYVLPKLTGRAPQVCEVCGYDFGADAPRTVTSRDGWAVKREDMTDEERAAVDWCIGRAASRERQGDD